VAFFMSELEKKEARNGTKKNERYPMTIEKEVPDRVTNTKFAEKDQFFRNACVKAGIEPTQDRQRSTEERPVLHGVLLTR